MAVKQRHAPDLSVGTHAYYLEVDADNEQQAEIRAGRHRVVQTLSWFHMVTTVLAPGRWLVKVAYEVEAA